jgi:hypothetical protein
MSWRWGEEGRGRKVDLHSPILPLTYSPTLPLYHSYHILFDFVIFTKFAA